MGKAAIPAINGKRKFSQSKEEELNLNLDLSLSIGDSSSSDLLLPSPSPSPSSPLPPFAPLLPPLVLPPSFQQLFLQQDVAPPPPPPQHDVPELAPTSVRRQTPCRGGRGTRRSAKTSKGTIPQPFAWATDKHATIHSLEYLMSNHLTKISGEMKCGKCNARYQLEYDLEEKFREVAHFIIRNKDNMRERAPKRWMSPEERTCTQCGEPSAKPVMPDKKEEINWLFLLLGEMLGHCTLDHLKYFCEYTNNHRTGAKDRVLFLTYLALCKQLDPAGPFER